jgi:hypothetical protein
MSASGRKQAFVLRRNSRFPDPQNSANARQAIRLRVRSPLGRDGSSPMTRVGSAPRFGRLGSAGFGMGSVGEGGSVGPATISKLVIGKVFRASPADYPWSLMADPRTIGNWVERPQTGRLRERRNCGVREAGASGDPDPPPSPASNPRAPASPLEWARTRHPTAGPLWFRSRTSCNNKEFHFLQSNDDLVTLDQCSGIECD